MYTDNKMILQVIALLKAHNINKVVISPGSRHFPLTRSLENDNFFNLYSIVDERSAAFFALGIIQRTNEPVVVCCTSGSAAANYTSAVSEAYYQKLPLMVLTADRLPEFLGQNEDQMIDQRGIFKGFIKYSCQLSIVRSDIDEWYVNRVINEACISLNQHGRGPVHINYPILDHSSDSFTTSSLPNVRKISYNSSECYVEKWQKHSEKLVNKKIMIIWGQSVNITPELTKSIDQFCEKFNCVILTDRISNFSHSKALNNSFVVLKSLSLEEKVKLFPDIVISVGGNTVFNPEIKGYLKSNSSGFENWQVGLNTKISDPYRRLSEMFEVSEEAFFTNVTKYTNEKLQSSTYFKSWEDVSNLVEEPNVEYSQLYVIGRLLKSLPENCILHLANSHTIRMSHMYNFDKTISCYCNRGVNGIDGCMSTAVGFAYNSDKINFLIIGDLTFFYDMNGLWNRYVPKNLRILLINNGAGGVMHKPNTQKSEKPLQSFTSAGHNTSARGWVESLGIKYYKATNQSEANKAIKTLTDLSEEGPMLMEVFTHVEEDVIIFHEYFSEISRVTLAERAKRKAKNVFSNYFKK